MNLLLFGILAYIVVQLTIGVVVSRGTRSEDDYLLAGRRLPMGVSVMTIFATWFGAETCIGASGAIYNEGLAGGRTDPFGYAGCIFLMGLVFAVPLYRRRLTTLGDLFRQRYSLGVERLAVILLIPGSVMWAAAQIRAFGQVLAASSDLQVHVAITAAAAVVIAYTIFGGLMADAVTDVLQGGVLVLGLIVLLGAVWLSGSGPDLSALTPERLSFAGDGRIPWFGRLEGWIIPIAGSVLSQELVARTLAAKSERVARNSAMTAGALYLMVGLIPLSLGLLGPGLVPGLEHSEQFLPALAQEVLPPVLYVVFAGALISAILSTVDSALLAAASLTSHNLILPFMPQADERRKVALARGAVAFFGVVAFILAINAEAVIDLVIEASAIGSAGIFVVVLFALFTRYGGITTAYSCLGVGFVVYVVGAHVLKADFPYIVALGAAFTTYTVVGLLEKAPAGQPQRMPEGA